MNRAPAGGPTGGQFTAGTSPEGSVDLESDDEQEKAVTAALWSAGRDFPDDSEKDHEALYAAAVQALKEHEVTSPESQGWYLASLDVQDTIREHTEPVEWDMDPQRESEWLRDGSASLLLDALGPGPHSSQT